MVTALVLAPEGAEPAWAQDRTRRELHEHFDLWLDSLEEAMKDKPPTLDVLAKEACARRQELTAQVTEALTQRRTARP